MIGIKTSRGPFGLDHQEQVEADIFFLKSSLVFWRNFCLTSLCEFGCVPIAHSSAVIATNSLQVPHIFNHSECHLCSAARHAVISPTAWFWITAGDFFIISVSFLPNLTRVSPFPMTFIFISIWPCVVPGPCVSVLSPSHKELWYLRPVKWTRVTGAAHTLYDQAKLWTYGMFC